MRKNIYYNFIFVIVLILLAQTTYCCNPEPGVQHFPGAPPPPRPPSISSGIFEVHSTLSGLPSNNILAVKMYKGLVFAGSADKGLLVLKENNWKAYNPSSNQNFPSYTIKSLEANENKLLAGTPQGLVEINVNEDAEISFKVLSIKSDDNLNVQDICFDVRKEQTILACARKTGFVNGRRFLPYIFNDIFAPPGFFSVLYSDGKIFAGSDQGLFVVKGNKLSKLYPDMDFGWVNDLAVMKKTKFMATANGCFEITKNGIEDILPGIWSVCLGINGMPELEKKLPAPLDINSVAAREARIASQEHEQNLLRRDELRGDFDRYLERARVTPPTVREVREMWGRFSEIAAIARSVVIRIPLQKGLWIGTKNQGLVLLSTDGQRFHLTYESSQLPSNRISDIDCADSGEAWFATENAGLLHYFRRERKIFPKLQLLVNCKPTRIRNISGRLVIGTKKSGMYIIDTKNHNEVRHLKTRDGFSFHEHVTDFAVDPDGVMWITGDKGLIAWDGKRFTEIGFVQDNIPQDIPQRIYIDQFGKVVAAFSNRSQMSSQVYTYNGEGLENLDVDKLRSILSLKGKEKREAMKSIGLLSTYQREFNLKNASEAVKLFDQTIPSPISAIVNISNYLLIGTESGIQNIFDGESYKPLSELGTGNPGKILNFMILPNKNTLIQGESSISIFDGFTYEKLLPVGVSFNMTDICSDVRNPETFWVSYVNGDSGGIALYEKPYWSLTKLSKPPHSLAVGQTYTYIASKDGVYYFIP